MKSPKNEDVLQNVIDNGVVELERVREAVKEEIARVDRIIASKKEELRGLRRLLDSAPELIPGSAVDAIYTGEFRPSFDLDARCNFRLEAPGACVALNSTFARYSMLGKDDRYVAVMFLYKVPAPVKP